MNLGAIYLVAFIVLELRTVALGWRGKHDGLWERFQVWEDKFEGNVWSQISAGGGAWCYGFTGEHDGPWLGTTDWITKQMDIRSYNIMRYEYTWFLDQKSKATMLTASPIMYKGKPLYGWFHLKLTTSDTNLASLEYVLAMVEGAQDVHAVAGSFVRTKFGKGTSCDTSGNAKDKYDYKPCQWAVDPYILAHNTFARKKPSGQGETSYEWNVKIDFPLCHIYYDLNAIYFRVIISQLSYNVTHFPLQKWIYLNDYNYGAPDPEPPRGAGAAELDCTKELDEKVAPWVRRRGALERNITMWYDTSLVESTRGWQAAGKIDQYSWGGRSPIGYFRLLSDNLQRFVPRVTNRYHCRRRKGECKYHFGTRLSIGPTPENSYLANDPSTYDNWTAPDESWTYPEIKDYLKQAFAAATIDCKSVKCEKAMKTQASYGVSASSTIGRYIFAGRQGHGILMVIACLFVYPLTNFVTRYFKGAFMSSRYIVNLHAWYAVHIYGTLTTLTFLLTGVGMGIYARHYLGYSYHGAGRAHVAFGYTACLLFFGGIVSNGWRCGRRATWSNSIMCHAFFGVLFYYLSLVTMAVAVWIPASPGGRKRRRESLGDEIAHSSLASATILFPLFEIVIHVIGTISMCKEDERYGVERDWACFVAIPWVSADNLDGEAGTELKSILFLVYLLGASLATIVALATIGTSNPEGHFFEAMTYTHVRGNLSTENIYVHQEAEDVLL